MTRLEGKHPRKPTWVHYLCNDCGSRFWAPEMATADGRSLDFTSQHRCEGCIRTDTHFTSGGSHGNPTSDMNYHGGEFTKGEW